MSLNTNFRQQLVDINKINLNPITHCELSVSHLKRPKTPVLLDPQYFNLNKGLQVKGGFTMKSSSNIFNKIQKIQPVSQSATCMVAAMSLHFFGYEFARSSNMALFTSSRMGFSSPSALPIAMTFVSPFSFFLLWFYGKQLEDNGPRIALRVTSLLCMAFMIISAYFISGIDHFTFHDLSPFLSKLIVWLSFVFQNSYAHLLYTQHWSFIGSILDKKQGARWFASIAGACSIASTIGASGASQLANVMSLPAFMFVTALSLLLSTILAERAYFLSEKHGFNPAKEMSKGKNTKEQEKETSINKSNTLRKAFELFKRVPILGALFFEVLSFQSLSMLSNISMVRILKATIENDAARASWTAKFYALINGVSGVLQFIVLPVTMQLIDPIWIWRVMPLISLCFSVAQLIQKNPSLFLVSSAFFTAKMMDYSFRGVANELVYMPLDFDSRFLGKEIIGVFANRFGKSGISTILFVLTSTFGDVGFRQLSGLITLSSAAWFSFALRVSNLLPKEVPNGGTRTEHKKKK